MDGWSAGAVDDQIIRNIQIAGFPQILIISINSQGITTSWQVNDLRARTGVGIEDCFPE